MAAHLVYLKSRELVPSPEPLEASDERNKGSTRGESLIAGLLEYQKTRTSRDSWAIARIEGRTVFKRGVR